MSGISELLKAIAALLWPIVAFIALVMFRNQIADAISRIKKGKLLGQELELSESLEQLQKSASGLSEEVASIPSPASEDPVDAVGDEGKEDESSDERVMSIIREASHSPKTALILLTTEIEKEAKQTLASIGKLGQRKHVSIRQAISELDSHYGLPRHVSSSLKQFWETRNQIIHGGEKDESDILSAIDSGVSILRSLKAMPRETNWVHHPGVDIYSDLECKIKISGAKGVILKRESPGGARVFFQIFPTTKGHFKVGRRVAWEWNMENSWSDAWYRDPDTGEIKSAWNSAAEFVGRDLQEI